MSKQVLASVIIPTFDRQEDVINCVASVMKSDYSNLEVVVVDNNSSDQTVEKLLVLYSKEPRFSLIQSKKNLGAGGGRNRGAKHAKGQYLLFVDSDNIIDRRMVTELVHFSQRHQDCGMVGPLMLWGAKGKMIWIYSADINMYTSQAKYKGTGEQDRGQYPEIVKVGHLPNCFMVSRSDFIKTKGFEERYQVVYEEADLAEKIKRLGKNIYLVSQARTRHIIPPLDKKAPQDYGFRSPERAFLLARNRVLFMKRNANLVQKLTFFILFNPLICLYYQFNLIRSGQAAKAWAYWKGCWTGLFY